MCPRLLLISGLLTLLVALSVCAQQSAGRTTLTQTDPRFTAIAEPSVGLQRGPLTVTVATNDPLPPDHRAGYNGIASLTHLARSENLFVPAYAGLNFEHIHDGSTNPASSAFEPRKAPMHLRRIDSTTVELYQPPTPNWRLESCTRFTLLPDGAIEMTFECIPRKQVFKYGYVGLFWASYVQQPESKAIHFLGRALEDPPDASEKWIEALSPRHGELSTHPPVSDARSFPRDPDFPPNFMVFSFSRYRYTRPFYYGRSHGMAFAYVFHPDDRIWFTQSPTGGGKDNPAWDFQFLIPDVRINTSYGFTMRALYLPAASPNVIRDLCAKHQAELQAPARPTHE